MVRGVGWAGGAQRSILALGTPAIKQPVSALGLANELQGTCSDMARRGEAIATRAAGGESALNWHRALPGVPFGALRWVVAAVAGMRVGFAVTERAEM